MNWRAMLLAAWMVCVAISAPALAQVAGETGGDDLVIAEAGAAKATILVAPKAGPNEKLAAADLAKFIELMTGAKTPIVDTDDAIAAALKGDAPLLIVGSAALAAEPKLQQKLDKVAKKDPILRADAVVVQRKGKRVYLAGNNDEAHYYAVAKLLQLWGCRWYLPTDFGQCIPEWPAIKVGKIDWAYGPKLEVREYWISWNGSGEGQREFQLRNYMNHVSVGGGHILGSYVKDLVPAGKSVFNVPITDPKTAEVVAEKVDAPFAKDQNFSLGMEDGTYESDFAPDKEMAANLWDKYMMNRVLTDNFMVFYNAVCKNLLAKHPQSKSKIGFLAYTNITIPPQRKIVAEKPLIASLAPIDIDPNHGVNDWRSPAAMEYGAMVKRWSEVMQGRVFIYDYDQGMLIWRDIPNPCLTPIVQNMKFYEEAGILGVDTESRNAIAMVFLNLHVRGQAMWDTSVDLKALLAEFYPKFYGPAAKEMEAYWNTLFKAWDDTIVTEHEYFAAPAIYTPELIAKLRESLEAGESAMKKAAGTEWEKKRDWAKHLERMKFTRLSYNLIEQYLGAVRAAAGECDYKAAGELGAKAVATRLEIAKMNTTFTTRIAPGTPAAETEAGGPAWMMGEIKQYRDIGSLTDGTKGKLVKKLPLEWAFRRDPHDSGLASGWAYQPEVDMTTWNKVGKTQKLLERKDYPPAWEMIRTDLYVQAQGVLHPDMQSYTGYMFYKTDVDLSDSQAAGNLRLHFPGLFNEGWLYVNGVLVAFRPQKAMWWINDYKFDWDVDLKGVVKPGKNTITLRLNCEHHFGGMFRRPFLYTPVP
ncbi:MAG: DUF4838 domain-containing protein [Planctomycetota bacterium]|nr:DUF4838 domain-containing protein [Planctomycetota bacterium]